MNKAIILSIVLAVAAVLGAAPQTYAVAGIFAALYIVFSLLPLKEPTARPVLLSAAGLPLILSAGYAVTAGITAALLLISLLSFTDALSSKTAVLSVLGGVAAALCALQSSVLPAVVIAALIAAAGVYAFFIFEYRIRKQLKVNPHEQK